MLLYYLSLVDTEEERSKLENLYYEYKALMKYVAFNILEDNGLAEDAVHEAFIKLTRHLDGIDEIKSHKTKAFIVIIIRCVALDMHVNINLTNSSGNAKCTTTVNGYAGTATKIKITMTLQKKTLFWWSKDTSWTTTVSDYYASLSKTASVGSGTYRVKAECVVYSGSASETITQYSSERTF